MGDRIDDHCECNNQYTNYDKNQYEPRKILNFNAPLLTTRRPANLAAISLSSCPSLHRRSNTTNDDLYSIPFSWEKAPGKPKDTHIGGFDNHDDDQNLTPRPKLPPSLWRYRHMITAPMTKNDDDNDIGCNEDFDDEDVYKDDDEIFSDAMEVFSLSEAIDIVERSQRSHDQAEGLRLKIIEDRSRSDKHEYPDFIIQRFLPDATALATASALSTAITLKNSNNNSSCFEGLSYKETAQKNSLASRIKTMSFSSLKGCGFKMLFPWSVKHRLCSVKNPVRRGGSSDHVLSGCKSMQFLRRHNEIKRG